MILQIKLHGTSWQNISLLDKNMQGQKPNSAPLTLQLRFMFGPFALESDSCQTAEMAPKSHVTPARILSRSMCMCETAWKALSKGIGYRLIGMQISFSWAMERPISVTQHDVGNEC